MARDEAPPFARGETYYNGGPIDSSNLGGQNLEGKEYTFEVNAPDATGLDAGDPSGRKVVVRVVRNSSGQALKGARVAHYKAEAPQGCHVDGYTFSVGHRAAGVIDEFLPAAGVPSNDLFYLVVQGPTKMTQTHTSAAAIVIDSILVPTAGGAGSVTDDLGGRVTLQDLTGATATLGNNVQNVVGFAGAASATVVDDVFAAVVRRGLFG
jgi:hypothetical protein